MSPHKLMKKLDRLQHVAQEYELNNALGLYPLISCPLFNGTGQIRASGVAWVRYPQDYDMRFLLYDQLNKM